MLSLRMFIRVYYLMGTKFCCKPKAGRSSATVRRNGCERSNGYVGYSARNNVRRDFHISLCCFAVRSFIHTHSPYFMQISKTRCTLSILAGFVIFAMGFCIGGVHAARSAIYSGHAATLVWLTGIDGALKSNNIEKASKITGEAVDAHLFVLRQIADSHSAGWLYVSPWHSFVDPMTQDALNVARNHYKDKQEQLSPESREFLFRNTNP